MRRKIMNRQTTVKPFHFGSMSQDGFFPIRYLHFFILSQKDDMKVDNGPKAKFSHDEIFFFPLFF